MALEVRSLNKKYGKVQALKNVSFKIDTGVYGLLGPNGAGKSTMIRIITGSMRASSGEVLYNGRRIRENEKAYKKILGYVPQRQGMYDSFTAARFLEYMAVLKELKRKEIPEEVERVLKIVGLQEDALRRLGGFSGGMKQRVLIAQALLGDPRIIILDEPTAGLDPKERIKIRNFISRIGENRTILLATHVVSDVESIAREILLLGDGVLKEKGVTGWLLAGVGAAPPNVNPEEGAGVKEKPVAAVVLAAVFGVLKEKPPPAGAELKLNWLMVQRRARREAR